MSDVWFFLSIFSIVALVMVLIGRYHSKLSHWHEELEQYRRALEEYRLKNTHNRPNA